MRRKPRLTSPSALSDPAGESIQIFAEIENCSSRMVVPKAAIYQTQTFYAKGKMKEVKQLVANLRGESLSSGKTETWSGKMLKIPPVSPSILDCSIIRVEYSLMVSSVSFCLPAPVSAPCFLLHYSLPLSLLSPLLNAIISAESIFPSKPITLLVKDLADSARIAKSQPCLHTLLRALAQNIFGNTCLEGAYNLVVLRDRRAPGEGSAFSKQPTARH